MDSWLDYLVIAAPLPAVVGLLVLAWRNHTATNWLQQRETRNRERARQARLAAQVAALERKSIWQEIEQLHTEFVARTGFDSEWQRSHGQDSPAVTAQGENTPQGSYSR